MKWFFSIVMTLGSLTASADVLPGFSGRLISNIPGFPKSFSEYSVQVTINADCFGSLANIRVPVRADGSYTIPPVTYDPTNLTQQVCDGNGALTAEFSFSTNSDPGRAYGMNLEPGKTPTVEQLQAAFGSLQAVQVTAPTAYNISWGKRTLKEYIHEAVARNPEFARKLKQHDSVTAILEGPFALVSRTGNSQFAFGPVNNTFFGNCTVSVLPDEIGVPTTHASPGCGELSDGTTLSKTSLRIPIGDKPQYEFGSAAEINGGPLQQHIDWDTVVRGGRDLDEELRLEIMFYDFSIKGTVTREIGRMDVGSADTRTIGLGQEFSSMLVEPSQAKITFDKDHDFNRKTGEWCGAHGRDGGVPACPLGEITQARRFRLR